MEKNKRKKSNNLGKAEVNCSFHVWACLGSFLLFFAFVDSFFYFGDVLFTFPERAAGCFVTLAKCWLCKPWRIFGTRTSHLWSGRMRPHDSNYPKEVLEIGAAVASVSAPSLQPSSTIFNHLQPYGLSTCLPRVCKTVFYIICTFRWCFRFVGRKISQSNHRIVILGCGRILSKTSQYDCTYTLTYIDIYTYTHTHIHIHMHIHIRSYTYTYIYICTHTYNHKYIVRYPGRLQGSGPYSICCRWISCTRLLRCSVQQLFPWENGLPWKPRCPWLPGTDTTHAQMHSMQQSCNIAPWLQGVRPLAQATAPHQSTMVHSSTLQILEKYRCFRNLTYIDWFYPKHLDTTLVFDFRTLIAWFWAWWDKGQKIFAAYQTTREKTRKSPQQKKNAKTRKSWNIVVLGSFRIFLLFQKSSRFMYPAVVLRFSRKHIYLEQSESFLVCLTYLLRTTIFSSAVEGRGYYGITMATYMATCCDNLFRNLFYTWPSLATPPGMLRTWERQQIDANRTI